jgi:hypothetical protein
MTVVQALRRLFNFDVEGKKRQKGVHNGLHTPRASSHAYIDVLGVNVRRRASYDRFAPRFQTSPFRTVLSKRT